MAYSNNDLSTTISTSNSNYDIHACVDGNGNHYRLVKSTDDYWKIYKSTNGGSSFSYLSSFSDLSISLFDLADCSVVSNENHIALCYSPGTLNGSGGTDYSIVIIRFNMSSASSNPDSWLERKYMASQHGKYLDISPIALKSNGDLVGIYCTYVDIGGTWYGRVSAFKIVSNTLTSGITIHDFGSNTINYKPIGIMTDLNNDSIIFIGRYNSYSRTLYSKTWSDAFSFGTLVTWDISDTNDYPYTAYDLANYIRYRKYTSYEYNSIVYFAQAGSGYLIHITEDTMTHDAMADLPTPDEYGYSSAGTTNYVQYFDDFLGKQNVLVFITYPSNAFLSYDTMGIGLKVVGGTEIIFNWFPNVHITEGEGSITLFPPTYYYDNQFFNGTVDSSNDWYIDIYDPFDIEAGIVDVALSVINPTVNAQNLAALPIMDVTNDGWLDENFNTDNIYLSIDEVDVDDDDYIQSLEEPDSEVYKVKISTLYDFGNLDNLQVKYRAKIDDIVLFPAIDTMDLNVRLVQNTTIIAQWTETGLTTLYQDFVHELTSGEASSITNFDQLYLEFRGITTYV